MTKFLHFCHKCLKGVIFTDFFQIRERTIKNGVLEIYPEFITIRSSDLMVRGKSFYAIWDENKGLWSTDEYDVVRLVDRELYSYAKDRQKNFNGSISVKDMASFSSNSWLNFQKFVKSVSDCYHQLDTKLTFSNDDIKKEDYASKQLPYPLKKGKCKAYEELIGTLYEPEERAKLEWAIGSIISGDSKYIQKFIVLYGEAGAGKSTILNIIQKLFSGYYVTFDARSLGSSNNSFATEIFRSNPLVAIQHDGDLSKIEDNTKLNSIVSHEEMLINEKFKAGYTSRIDSFLFMATNRPVKITDAKSGIIRRLIDVRPSGNRIAPKKYQALVSGIEFELGAIAYHCLETYQKMGKNYYNGYVPIDMMLKTDVFFNFVEENFYIFKEQDGISLKQAYDMYKAYCDETAVEFKIPRYKFREELKNYFRSFSDVTRIDGKQVRSYYSGFIFEKFQQLEVKEEEYQGWLYLDKTESIFDKEFCDLPAQYATEKETPMNKWDKVTTKLSDIDTSKIHYVKLPSNHIVIDFDIKDENGEKSYALNFEAASKWPPTYCELSKGGSGIHLHYIFDGDVETLSNVYDKDIEVKTFMGKSSLRRKLTKCNDILIAHISSGLFLKGVKKMVNFTSIANEKAIRTLIDNNLKKQYHPGTKPSIDYIYKILEDAYSSKISYDVKDLRPKVLAFANNSTHQADYCLKMVNKMKFSSESISKPEESNSEMVFFDVEVFPNLFLVNWKYAGEDKKCNRMINPTPSQIEELLKMKLVGFNCRRYDNHILYARYLGLTNYELFVLSQNIINSSQKNYYFFSEAYNISYTDVYDFSSAGNKKSLKKWEIELGIHHQELNIPWDEDVPEELWLKVAEYCDNDVIATEKVFNHLSGDWAARQILARLSGLSVNDTTNAHSTRIIFGDNRNPQSEFVYTDLSEMFPGYRFDNGKSYYRDEETGEGGYVYSEPGMYKDVALLDIESMHPTSMELLNLFGPYYTKRFSELKKARVLIKHQRYEEAKLMLDGLLVPFIEELENGTASYTFKDLANALKTVINSIYGLTSAKFDNPFRDPRNKDNIVAKRGALFMIDLKHAVQEMGYTVAHIKTDSIKIPDATPEIIDFVMAFGKKYGYNFEHEATYSHMCLVNDAVYIARYKDNQEWTATGAQFAHPYVFKRLFSKEAIKFEDKCETKSVSSSLYLDMNEDLTEDEHNYIFVGKVGSFCPIKPGCGGGLLMREKDGKYYAVTGTKGYRWMEAEVVKELNKEDSIDESYFVSLVDQAVHDISSYGDFDWFRSDDMKGVE